MRRLFRIVKFQLRLTGFYLFFLVFFAFSFTALSGQYYGMKFSGHDFSLDQRSGLNLTPEHPLHIEDQLDLQFYFRLEPERESYFGYVFRAIVGNHNLDLIYSIIEGNPNNFELILGDRTSRIAFPVPYESLTDDWLHLRFEFDFKNKRVTCYVNDTVIVDELKDYDRKNELRLMFGAHSYENFTTTDVPAMVIRDIEVNSNHFSFHWPLNETQGTIAHSVPKGNNGLAANPGWLLKLHNTWDNILNKEVEGMVKVTFDPRNEDLYIVSQDTVYIYNVNSLVLIHVPTQYPIESANELIYDTVSNQLILYSVDNNYYSIFDFETGEWSSHDPGTGELTDYWHHNRFITPDGDLMIFGGYGNFTYKNSVLEWNREQNRFDSIDFMGSFYPRYLAGAGFNPNDSLFYIAGGYGSESGKQAESPDYYFQILCYSLEERTFNEIYEFPDVEGGFCLANSIVFDDADNLYALKYSKYQFNNKLQLIRIPLENPEIIELGSPIDYSFLDVNSFADLFLRERSRTMLAVTSYTSEGHTTLKVHSIAFPPQAYSGEETPAGKSNWNIVFYFIVAFVFVSAVLVYFFFRRKHRTTNKTLLEISPEAEYNDRKNRIILFGGFQVFDKEGKDITGHFTPLTKSLLLFILLHTLRYEKGVSSNLLYETFWFDKSPESARNNRAVNILKLKSLLENLESVTISKDTGYWKFYFDPSLVYIDYYEYLRIIHQKKSPSREQIARLQSIIESRSFLVNTAAEWLDPFKAEISNEIIDMFLLYINNSGDDPEFLLHLVNCIFLYDTTSEEALKVQCRLLIKQGKHSLAKKAYSNFVNEYWQLYNEKYTVSYNEIIDHK